MSEKRIAILFQFELARLVTVLKSIHKQFIDIKQSACVVDLLVSKTRQKNTNNIISKIAESVNIVDLKKIAADRYLA